jgi:hypothetical protein
VVLGTVFSGVTLLILTRVSAYVAGIFVVALIAGVSSIIPLEDHRAR